jgi:hypothetical protein
MIRRRYWSSSVSFAVIGSTLALTFAVTAAVGEGTPAGLQASMPAPTAATRHDPSAAGLAVPGQPVSASVADEPQEIEHATTTPQGDPSGLVGPPPSEQAPTKSELTAAGIRPR